jgi:CubicO group peptidase (beta-lactamase class C family)
MRDTGFSTSPEQDARLVTVHQRAPDGSLTPQPFETPSEREFLAGGGGLRSTASDYLRFLQMLLQGGTLNGAKILRPETVALMAENHIGHLQAGVLKANWPHITNDVDLFPDQQVRWGLGYMLIPEPGPHGRSAGSLAWAGIFNTYYWLDPAKRVAGVIMTQILPFADPATLGVLGDFERAVYAAIGEA